MRKPRTGSKVDAVHIERHVGPAGWPRVQRAAWTGRRLDDPTLAAAAAITARNERRATGHAALAFAILLLGALTGLLEGADVWGIALLSLALVGSVGSVAAWLWLSRAIAIHAATAGPGQMQSLESRIRISSR